MGQGVEGVAKPIKEKIQEQVGVKVRQVKHQQEMADKF